MVSRSLAQILVENISAASVVAEAGACIAAPPWTSDVGGEEQEPPRGAAHVGPFTPATTAKVESAWGNLWGGHIARKQLAEGHALHEVRAASQPGVKEEVRLCTRRGDRGKTNKDKRQNETTFREI